MTKCSIARIALSQILLAVLVFRSLVPAGYMLAPETTSAGVQLTVTICTGHGQTKIPVSADQSFAPVDLADTDLSPGQTDDDSQPWEPQKQLCPFAASIPLGSSDAVPYVTASTAAKDSPHYVTASVEQHECRYELPQPARGPPTLQS